jgi:hypothetical protein
LGWKNLVATGGQIILINYCSSSDLTSKVVHTSLGLIYCWHKDQQNKVFDDIFPNENLYWQRMNQITNQMFFYGSKLNAQKILDYLSV